MAIIDFDDTLGCLAVEEIGDDRFGAPHIPMAYRRVFGGQLLAQCVAVAARTAPEKTVRSLHATFPREGDLAEPLAYRATRLQDGRSFASRRLTGTQGEHVIVAALVSLHAGEPGPEQALAAPAVPGPEACPARSLSMIPWETRVVDDVDLTDRAVGPPRYGFWMRTPPLGDDPARHQALLAHATDLTVIGTLMRPLEGLSEADSPERVRTAVTTHTVWFHAPFRADDWLLVHQEGVRLGGARGFGIGHVHTRAGALVASFAQESLIRPVPAAPDGPGAGG